MEVCEWEVRMLLMTVVLKRNSIMAMQKYLVSELRKRKGFKIHTIILMVKIYVVRRRIDDTLKR